SWHSLQQQRWHAIDGTPTGLDQRFIGALGEPAYWAASNDGIRPDNGASAWEMKTRNRGEDFVRNRLSLLAKSVSQRGEQQVLSGLLGTSIVDEVGKNGLDSRTPTGLAAPGVADNARAWCALWAISLFPVRPVLSADLRYPQ